MSHSITVAYQVEHGPMYYIDECDNADDNFIHYINNFIASLPDRLQCHVAVVSEYDYHQPIRMDSDRVDPTTLDDFTTVETMWAAHS